MPATDRELEALQALYAAAREATAAQRERAIRALRSRGFTEEEISGIIGRIMARDQGQ
jgi:SOS response regulatory protein OraA/RecX